MEIQQHDGVVVDVAGLRHGFAEHYGGGGRVGGGRATPGKRSRLPSHPSTIHRVKGRGGGALGFPLGGGG